MSGEPRHVYLTWILAFIYGSFFSLWSALASTVQLAKGAEVIAIRLRRFRITRQLGEGGYSTVYLAREDSDPGSRDYAIKKASEWMKLHK